MIHGCIARTTVASAGGAGGMLSLRREKACVSNYSNSTERHNELQQHDRESGPFVCMFLQQLGI